MTRAKWSAERERVYRAAMRWLSVRQMHEGRNSPRYPGKLCPACWEEAARVLKACAADAAARKRAVKWKPDTPSPYDLSEPVRRKK